MKETLTKLSVKLLYVSQTYKRHESRLLIGKFQQERGTAGVLGVNMTKIHHVHVDNHLKK